MTRFLCCSRLLTAWCLIVVFALVTIAQLCYYLSRNVHPYKHTHYVGSFPRRRSDLSLCPQADVNQRRFPITKTTLSYRCKRPRRKSFVHLDPKKFVFARYLAEVNGTIVEESNSLNLIANAIDLNGYVLRENPLITSRCLLSKNSDECFCSCLGVSGNCTSGTTEMFGRKCSHKADILQVPGDEEFHNVLCDNGLPRLMLIDSFLHNSYRNIVFVHPINKQHPDHKLSSEQRSIQNRLRLDSPIIDCSEFESVHNMSTNILTDLNILSKSLCLSQFKMAGCYCIAAWYKSNDLGMYWFADGQVSIVFTSWIGLDRDDSDILIPASEASEPKSNPGDPQPDPSSPSKPTEETILHGVVRRRHHSSLAKMVLQQTKKFIKAMAQGKQYIVIHLRVDSSFSSYTQRPDFQLYYKTCIFKIKAELNKLEIEHPDSLVFFFMDFGNDLNSNENSSATFQFHSIKSMLLENKHEIQHYSPDKFGGRSDTPFVTLVEQEFMCRASYLLAMGGGQIQERLKKRFLKMHFRKKLLDFEFCDVDPLDSGPKYI